MLDGHDSPHSSTRPPVDGPHQSEKLLPLCSKYLNMSGSIRLSLTVGHSGSGANPGSALQIEAVVNPLSKAAQRLAPVLEWLRSSFDASIKVNMSLSCMHVAFSVSGCHDLQCMQVAVCLCPVMCIASECTPQLVSQVDLRVPAAEIVVKLSVLSVALPLSVTSDNAHAVIQVML